MRIVHTALFAIVVVSAVPSVGSAQVLTPIPFRHDLSRPDFYRLDHPVPVATVSLVGDIVALADARVVQDPSGEPFVLGTAKLDLRDPSHAKVVFTITNATDTPIPLNEVRIQERTMMSWKPENYPRGDVPTNGLGGTAGRDGELQQGKSVTVQIPISPPNCRRVSECELQGFLVFVGRPWPHPDLSAPSDPGWEQLSRREKALFTRAFEALRSQASQ